ncbi:MAG: thermonuclease [Candidatus Omnitrophica bacterium CG08_land_8_20_14_0_20_41_16]|uniref:Thermonuclease n=1 Tax=Candidatus Sherwoodlollariibacterium unditelluris TaxID=1974757 RepID=A0A2G9YL10_9BACT|nr:MAG: thermonuclease [Candidatus Omnitrophica bacterium CG23_combo_of_CG06-09_8_20_14_all_41_10]PIS33935.1 MAG: thermonuclease [Candidatus Omnitrophica bacterium CG08_land_8_20_14_0_20_41_16]
MKYLKVILILTLGILIFGGYLCAADLEPPSYPKEEVKFRIPIGKAYDYTKILVKRAVDGDTLLLENGERVRLIGIDTPEMHESNKLNRDAQRSGQDVETIKQLGRRSYEFTKKIVEGKRVRLEFDVERFDRYKRILAYVYLLDGTFLNAEIVQQGYASLMTYPPNVKYADLFLKLYREARENKRGLWKD